MIATTIFTLYALLAAAGQLVCTLLLVHSLMLAFHDADTDTDTDTDTDSPNTATI